MVRGPYEEGSKNDRLMTMLVGADWRAITGVDGERVTAKSSPGYDHASYWPGACEEEQAWLKWKALQEGSAGDAADGVAGLELGGEGDGKRDEA